MKQKKVVGSQHTVPMTGNRWHLLFVLLSTIAIIVASCGGGTLAKPGPLGRGQAIGSLNGKHPKFYPECQEGDETKEIFKILKKIAKWFGGDVKYGAHCGSYERELAAGVTLGAPAPPPGESPDWHRLGGSGDLMADAMLCLMKDIGEAQGGKIVRYAPVSIGNTGLAIEQTIGLSKFDATAKRADLYQQVRVCAPIIGCFDTQRQTIVAQVRQSEPAWPGGMKAGDYPVANSYSLDISATWADTNFGATLPPITVVTPYGSATLQPEFSFFSSLYPVDTPFDFKGSSKIYLNHPKSLAPDHPIVQDTYGRSGIPFILHVITNHKPPAYCSNLPLGSLCDDPFPPPSGWSSQIAFGARNGVGSVTPWNPGAGAKWPERPDLDTDSPRSKLEKGPTANFTASSPVTIKPPMQDLLDMVPSAAKGLIGDIGLEIVITPQFIADYATQFAFMEREGSLSNCVLAKEFGVPCGLAEAVMYAQARAEGRMDLSTNLHFWIDFNFELPFGPDPDISFSDGFTIPIGGPNKKWDPPLPSSGADPYTSTARASLIAVKPGEPYAQVVKGLSGLSHGDIHKWTQQCLKTPPKSTSQLPDPTHQPGSPDDLKPGLLPCNICVADTKQNKYAPFVFPEVKAKIYSQKWTCKWEGQLGCYDLCTWKKTADDKAEFIAAVRSAVEVVGQRCATDPPPVVK